MYLLLGTRSLLGCVFLVSFVGKAWGRTRYDGYLAATRRLMPRWAASRIPARAAAPGILAAEAAVPVLLAVPASVLAGLALSCVLMAVFAAATAAALRRGENAPCHCFGFSQRELTSGHVTRNVVLAVLALAGVIAGTSSAARPVAAVDAAVVVALAVVFALLFAIADDLADVFRSAG
ncbi:MauE/DoxX family redox-associated membrane protein [Actinospica robiniae]|uniref:Methylamine utilization protein MauE n=1 Tax=Actinospica robiniae DSM 44927 TaxID=479430 RepID=W9DW79_9ACTN|nr:Methylamine utilization protein MauE [Actinospica robiniae DSM 44927]